MFPLQVSEWRAFCTHQIIRQLEGYLTHTHLMWTRPSKAPWESLLKCIWSICISVLAPFLRVLDFHPGTETVAAPFTEHVSFHIQ